MGVIHNSGTVAISTTIDLYSEEFQDQEKVVVICDWSYYRSGH